MNFYEYAEKEMAMLKADVESARLVVDQMKEAGSSVEVIEAAKKIAVDRFARWQAVSNLLWNYDTIKEHQVK